MQYVSPVGSVTIARSTSSMLSVFPAGAISPVALSINTFLTPGSTCLGTVPLIKYSYRVGQTYGEPAG